MSDNSDKKEETAHADRRNHNPRTSDVPPLERRNRSLRTVSLAGVLWVDNHTRATPEVVASAAPTFENARIELKDGMRAGQQVAIPASVGVHRARFQAESGPRALILAVILWESDETPKAAMRAGYGAFRNELRAAVRSNLLLLNEVKDNKEQFAIVVREITTRVRKAIDSAIRGALTDWQKTKIFFGSLNLDDVVGSNFAFDSDLEPRPIHLTFRDAENDDETENIYDIDGRLQVRRVIDLCQTQVAAVNAANKVVDEVQRAIAALQAELKNAAPGEKPLINAEIKRLRDQEGRAATAALDEARRALQRCRDQQPGSTGGTTVGGGTVIGTAKRASAGGPIPARRA